MISTVAEELLAYTNIVPEWLCNQCQENLYSGDVLFCHVELIKAKKLHVFPRNSFDRFLFVERFSTVVVCVFADDSKEAANDVAFSIHAVLLIGITLIQVLIYDRGSQRVSRTCIAISCVVWISATVCVRGLANPILALANLSV
ncbi:hypothetical protein IFM89_028242 [Coptis chinensis]|uniref:Uncharacterized protein n=1 Tax=Coptis chinensis TaxID=261450 RepID=A0A835MCA1_9MAGN|nr:hypothetical protein IFM89_028242 [Coptis chinensis]